MSQLVRKDRKIKTRGIFRYYQHLAGTCLAWEPILEEEPLPILTCEILSESLFSWFCQRYNHASAKVVMKCSLNEDALDV